MVTIGQMPNRVIAIVLLMLMMPILLTGCWNKRELNELSVASAFGFDKDGDRYTVSVQLINAGQIESRNSNSVQQMPVVTHHLAGGRTIFESIREMTTTTPRKIYSAHIRLVVIGEELAKDGIAKVLDGLSRDHELRTDFYIIIARGTTAANVLKILTPMEKIPSNKLYSSLTAAETNWGVSVRTDLHELIYKLVSKGTDPALAAVRIIGDPKVGASSANLTSVDTPTVQQFRGAAVFRRDKLVGWLTSGENKGFNYAEGKIKSTIVRIPCEGGGQMGIELIRTNAKTKVVMENGKPAIHVRIRTEGNIGEMECAMKVEDNRAIAKLQAEVSEQIKLVIEAALKKARACKADIFGFGEDIHRARPRLWHTMEKDWNERFVNLPVHIQVESKIRRTGSVVGSFLEDMEK